MGVRRLFHIVLILILIPACVKVDSESDQLDKNLLVEAVLVSGQNLSRIHVSRLGENGQRSPLNNLDIELTGPLGVNSLNALGDGIYGDEDLNIFASADYRLLIRDGDMEAEGETSTPPAFELINTIPSTVSIDTEEPFDQLFAMDWSENGEVEYLLNLVVLENDPIAIEFEGADAGQFSEVFANPQPESGTVILASDLEFYGSHRIDVYAVESDYAELFNPFQLTDNDDVPYISNELEGATGYFTGVTVLSVSFNVE